MSTTPTPTVGSRWTDKILGVTFEVVAGPIPSTDPNYPDEVFWDVDSSDGFGTVTMSGTVVAAGLAGAA